MILPLEAGPASRKVRYFLDLIASLLLNDCTDDLKKIDKPTLIIHGDDDQIVPIGASALESAKIVEGSILKVYQAAPHGLAQTHTDVSTRTCSTS